MQHLNVAVLLATYNGSQYVQQQINSLKDNTTAFTLHWLDDHSSDNTRDVVRSSAKTANIPLSEWHPSQRCGVPRSFFQLLECVEADIYLFCDQDDIWSPGKIDATVADLAPGISLPVLVSSDVAQFHDDRTVTAPSVGEFVGMRKLLRAMREPPVFLMFLHALAPGASQGFTRPLRNIFLQHKAVAGGYALMHDCWMYDIAIACGTVRLFSNTPTASHRLHRNNFTRALYGQGRNLFTRQWQSAQSFRRLAARHAQGFVLATPTLPPGKEVDRLFDLAQLIATVDRRQTSRELLRLARLGAMPWWGSLAAAWFSAACLCCDATPSEANLPLSAKQ